MFYLLSIVLMLVGMLIQWRLKSKFEEYGSTRNLANLTGEQIAKKMLHDHGIYDVQVVSVDGMLSDHYNPLEKTVNLSPEVFSQPSVSAAAVAAHECGHAVQHATAYSMLTLRSKIVPVVSLASNWMTWIILAGIIALRFGNIYILTIGVILFALTTIFSFITLPVEFDASARALKWLEDKNITGGEEHDKAKDALKWAAMTYVVAALGSLVSLLHYVSILAGARRRD
jgi:Zn-dependent membrane protease YugP